MSLPRHARRIARIVVRTVLTVIAAVLAIVAVALLLLQTGWAKDRVRRVIVSQANQYLNASLEIGRLGGSLLRGVELDDVRLTRDGRTIVSIDQVLVDYSIRELAGRATTIRRLRVVRPVLTASRTAEGGWNLGGLLRTRPPKPSTGGSPRPLEIQSLEVVDATVHMENEVTFGPVHVPPDLSKLDATLSVSYAPPEWRVQVQHVAWQAADPMPTIRHMSGGISNTPQALTFNRYSIETAAGDFTLDGRIDRTTKPSTLDLTVHATRFDFTQWGDVIHGLSAIGVVADLDATLRGPAGRLDTTLNLRSTGGSVRGRVVLDTTVPGWHGQGTLDVAGLDLARWLKNPEKPSDITGTVTFNLALELGRHFPRGTYVFAGARASFMGYGATNVRARGTITQTEALVSQATARAYGADVTITDGAIGIDAPFPYRFAGAMTTLDLRRVPRSIPVPHVESTLAFQYDVHGRFRDAYIAGRARFDPSVFLGARLGAGTTGTIDTSATPLQYAGEGDVSDFDINHVGRGLDVAWMQDPRYAGSLAGHFQVQASGADGRTLTLDARGRIAKATLFSGTISDAAVSLAIAHGTLTTTFDGHCAGIDPAVALSDPRFRATLSGSANVRTTVADLLLRSPGLHDYTVSGSLALQPSTIRGVDLTSGRMAGELAGGVATLSDAAIAGPMVDGHGSGVVSFVDRRPSDFQYALNAVDLAKVTPLAGWQMAGTMSTTGRLTGTAGALRLTGDGTLRNADSTDFSALSASAHYDVTAPWGDFGRAAAALQGSLTFARVAGVPVENAHGTVSLNQERVTFDLDVLQSAGRSGTLAGAAVLRLARQQVELTDLSVGFGGAPWRLASTTPPVISWSGTTVSFSPIVFAGGPSLEQQITVSGTWGGPAAAVHVTARNVHLETLEGVFAGPARYGGVVNLDATLRGSRQQPIVTGRLRVSDGRIRRLTYNDVVAQVDYRDGLFDVAFRLDQSSAVWIRADGTVPLALFARGLPPRPINLAITSSPIDLGLIEGVTDVIRNVGGRLIVNVRVTGPSDSPQFVGSVAVDNGGFVVAATGVRYKNARAIFQLSPDQVAVRGLHLEDDEGDPLDVTGSLATRQLKPGAVSADITAQHLSVLHNALGDLETNATLAVRGTLHLPQVSGDVSLQNGTLHADQILEQLLFQPYSTTEAEGLPAASPSPETKTAPPLDALAALNPWDRLALAIDLRVPETLRLTGQDIQISPGTPIGVGSISLRAGGDLWLIKDAGQPLGVYGSLDSVNGTYAFQSRQFDIQPGSSINFRGDLTPEVYVTVAREITGVQTRVTITGPLRNPELQLASTPPLDPSDVLALVVFGTTTNQLSGIQQQELAVRAGALAAGFLATPIVSAIESSLGLDLLEIEPTGDFGTGPRVTVGQELAPGLVARFSRQFGPTPYDQATIEYYLSRILQIRATFSDAASLNIMSPFRRIERAGIDLLLLFSF
ncbi:MAG: translocation/assembly module TamB domain-containing protein [Betaproteobacteria bacterium]